MDGFRMVILAFGAVSLLSLIVVLILCLRSKKPD
jgi:hypothetical protein